MGQAGGAKDFRSCSGKFRHVHIQLRVLTITQIPFRSMDND
jgi:hypothetical protein